MAANIVTTGKKTQSNSSSIALSNFTIDSGTDLALYVIHCGNYNKTSGWTATWNQGSSQNLTLITYDAYSSWGSCVAFVLTNPNTGTGTITIGGISSGEDSVLYAFVVENVNQSTPTADASGDTASQNASKTLNIENMTANDLAIAAISVNNNTASVTITTGNNIGADSTDQLADTDGGAAYNTGTGNVEIVFGKASGSTHDGGALKFRIVGVSAAATSLPAFINNSVCYAHLLAR